MTSNDNRAGVRDATVMAPNIEGAIPSMLPLRTIAIALAASSLSCVLVRVGFVHVTGSREEGIDRRFDSGSGGEAGGGDDSEAALERRGDAAGEACRRRGERLRGARPQRRREGRRHERDTFTWYDDAAPADRVSPAQRRRRAYQEHGAICGRLLPVAGRRETSAERRQRLASFGYIVTHYAPPGMTPTP